MKRVFLFFLLLFLVSASLNTIGQEKISLSNKYGYHLEGTKKGKNLIEGTELIVRHTGVYKDLIYDNTPNRKYIYTDYKEQLKGTIFTKGDNTYLTGEYSTSSKSRILKHKKKIKENVYYSEYDEYLKVFGEFLICDMPDSSFSLMKFKKAERIITEAVKISQIEIDTVFKNQGLSDTISYRSKKNKKDSVLEISYRFSPCLLVGPDQKDKWTGNHTLTGDHIYNITGKVPFGRLREGDDDDDVFDMIDTFKIQYSYGYFVGTILKDEIREKQGWYHFCNYKMMTGTFYFKTGEIYKGNVNVIINNDIRPAKTESEILIDGEWILRDGSVKKGNWLLTDFYEDEREKISKGKNILDRLQIINDILEQHKIYYRDFPEMVKVTKDLEDEGNYDAAEKGYKMLIELADKINYQGTDVDLAKTGLLRIQQKKEQKRKEERRQRLVNKYGIKWADLIEKKELTIGMPRDAVFEFMPETVYISNKITTGSHVTETYRVDMSNAYIWAVSEAKKEGGDAGLRLLYEQAMMIKMFGGNPDIQFEKAIREMLPKLEFKDGKLSSYSSY